MLSAINRKLPANWHFTRILGLFLAIFFAFQAFVYKEVFAGLISAFFLIQVVTNTGCFGSKGCAVEPKHNASEAENIVYTQIENKKEQ